MPLAAGKNLLLNVLSAGDAVVIGDRDRIIQIGSNLLSNAIKFTERGSVTVRTQFDQGVLTLIVEDTGTGMDDEEQTRIFTAFERLPNAIAEEGVGLGLSIVKGLVGLLDGRIEVASRKGGQPVHCLSSFGCGRGNDGGERQEPDFRTVLYGTGIGQ